MTTPDLTLAEVAEILRVSVKQVRLLRAAGAFPNAYGSPNRTGWRVPRADLDAYLDAYRDAHRQPTTNPDPDTQENDQ